MLNNSKPKTDFYGTAEDTHFKYLSELGVDTSLSAPCHLFMH